MSEPQTESNQTGIKPVDAPGRSAERSTPRDIPSSYTEPSAQAIRRRTRFLMAGCFAAGSLCLLLWNANRSIAAESATRASRGRSIAADLRTIARLRERPQQAAESGLPRSDLLARVSRAMRSAQLDAAMLASTLPQPPRRVPGSDHAEIAHRLMFENVELRPLVRFCHALTTQNPQLRVAALQLQAGSDPTTWNADVSVSYWLLAPQANTSPRRAS
jgi:hypothetical protein